MIRSFRCRETERIFHQERSRRFPPGIQGAALRKLLMLHAADALEDLLVPPGNRLEAFKADRAGQYSIRVNAQHRICFTWRNGEAHDVALADYH